jgi:hypothetical protein
MIAVHPAANGRFLRVEAGLISVRGYTALQASVVGAESESGESNLKVKGVGQECPTHTSNFKSEGQERPCHIDEQSQRQRARAIALSCN